jgi:hypothetical protein
MVINKLESMEHQRDRWRGDPCRYRIRKRFFENCYPLKGAVFVSLPEARRL